MLASPAPATTPVPPFRRVLAVGAHPDDESFGLGAILDMLAGRGTQVWVLSFTRGEASTLSGDLPLGEVRARELAEAAAELGAAAVRLLDYADGGLDRVPVDQLAEDVRVFAVESGADALLAFDDNGITGHPDHCQATRAAQLAAEALGIPVLAWTVPADVAQSLNREFGTTFAGVTLDKADFRVRVDRSRQFAAIARHRSQSTDNPVLWRRLELLGETEWLRILGPLTREEMRTDEHSA